MISAYMASMYLEAITIIGQNLQIHGVSIKRINKTTPTATKQRVIN